MYIYIYSSVCIVVNYCTPAFIHICTSTKILNRIYVYIYIYTYIHIYIYRIYIHVVKWWLWWQKPLLVLRLAKKQGIALTGFQWQTGTNQPLITIENSRLFCKLQYLRYKFRKCVRAHVIVLDTTHTHTLSLSHTHTHIRVHTHIHTHTSDCRCHTACAHTSNWSAWNMTCVSLQQHKNEHTNDCVHASYCFCMYV